MSTMSRARQGVLALAAMGALLVNTIATGPTTATAAAGPSGLRATEVTTSSIGLTWSKQGENAYRVRMSTKSDMSSSKTWDVVGNRYEWTRANPNPDSTSDRLKPGTTYYFQVKSIEREVTVADRDNLSSYSSKIAVRTASSGYPELKPVGTEITSGDQRLYLSWASRGPGVRYLVRYTTNPAASVLDWNKATFEAASGTLTGLKADTKYYLRIRVLNAAGEAASSYSEVDSATTKATSAGLNFSTYNVNKASYTARPWTTRRGAVVAGLLGQDPDVIGLQEATPTSVVGLGGTKVPQYEDLVQRLGSPYKLATREGSSGTKLVYNTERLSVVDVDAKALTTLGDATRYAVWAVFKDKLSGSKFFVITTHLEPGSSTSSTYNQARITQAKEVLKLISANSDGLPVVLLGDLNSSRGAQPNNGPYLSFTGAGLKDPIDNARGSWMSGLDATAEHVAGIEYNSFNGYEENARRTAYPVGTHVDYILASSKLRVAKYQVVVAVDSEGDFSGTIPSDHNQVAATIHLS